MLSKNSKEEVSITLDELSWLKKFFVGAHVHYVLSRIFSSVNLWRRGPEIIEVFPLTKTKSIKTISFISLQFPLHGVPMGLFASLKIKSLPLMNLSSALIPTKRSSINSITTKEIGGKYMKIKILSLLTKRRKKKNSKISLNGILRRRLSFQFLKTKNKKISFKVKLKSNTISSLLLNKKR